MFSKAAAVTAAGVLATAGLATSTAHATTTPSVTATPACGKVTISATHPTRHTSLRLQYQVDRGPVRTITLAAAGTTAEPIPFREDSGDHLVRWRLWGGPERDWDKPAWTAGSYKDFDPRGFRGQWADTIRVESDCRPNWARADEPTVKQPRCRTDRGTLVIPRERGIVYKVNGRPWRPGEHQVPPGRYLVTAHAAEGWRLVGTHAWKRWVKPGGHCETGPSPEEATPVKPVLKQASCDQRASLAIPHAEGVVYKAGGAVLKQGVTYAVDPGPLVVTAEAVRGFELADDAPARWPFTVAETPDCQVSTPVPGVVVVNDAPVPTRVDTGLGGLARR